MKLFKFLFLFFIPLLTQIGFSQSVEQTPKSESNFSQKTEIQNSLCQTYLNQFEEIRFVQLEEFIKRLNQYGNCGYRMDQVVRFILDSDKGLDQMSFSALVRKDADNGRYEYAWFIATSPGEAQTLANKYAENGFYFRESMSFVYGRCGENAEKQKTADKTSGTLKDILNVEPGQMGSFFLFERKSGSFKKNEYRILDARITGKSGELEDNKRKLDDYVAKGFRPVDLWYTGDYNEHFVVIEKDESVKPEGDYIFLSAYYNMHERLSKLGKQGYKLIFAGLAFALLHRTSEEPLNIEYDSFDTYKDLDKKLRKWKDKEVSYITTGISGFYLHCDARDGKVFVALTPKTAAKNKEILFLVHSDFVDDYFKRKGLNPTKKNPLTEKQSTELDNEFTDKLNSLVREGYKLVNFSFPNAEVYTFERTTK